MGLLQYSDLRLAIPVVVYIGGNLSNTALKIQECLTKELMQMSISQFPDFKHLCKQRTYPQKIHLQFIYCRTPAEYKVAITILGRNPGPLYYGLFSTIILLDKQSNNDLLSLREKTFRQIGAVSTVGYVYLNATDDLISSFGEDTTLTFPSYNFETTLKHVSQFVFMVVHKTLSMRMNGNSSAQNNMETTMRLVSTRISDVMEVSKSVLDLKSPHPLHVAMVLESLGILGLEENQDFVSRYRGLWELCRECKASMLYNAAARILKSHGCSIWAFSIGMRLIKMGFYEIVNSVVEMVTLVGSSIDNYQRVYELLRLLENGRYYRKGALHAYMFKGMFKSQSERDLQFEIIRFFRQDVGDLSRISHLCGPVVESMDTSKIDTRFFAETVAEILHNSPNSVNLIEKLKKTSGFYSKLAVKLKFFCTRSHIIPRSCVIEKQAVKQKQTFLYRSEKHTLQTNVISTHAYSDLCLCVNNPFSTQIEGILYAPYDSPIQTDAVSIVLEPLTTTHVYIPVTSRTDGNFTLRSLRFLFLNLECELVLSEPLDFLGVTTHPYMKLEQHMFSPIPSSIYEGETYSFDLSVTNIGNCNIDKIIASHSSDINDRLLINETMTLSVIIDSKTPSPLEYVIRAYSNDSDTCAKITKHILFTHTSSLDICCVQLSNLQPEDTNKILINIDLKNRSKETMFFTCESVQDNFPFLETQQSFLSPGRSTKLSCSIDIQNILTCEASPSRTIRSTAELEAAQNRRANDNERSKILLKSKIETYISNSILIKWRTCDNRSGAASYSSMSISDSLLQAVYDRKYTVRASLNPSRSITKGQIVHLVLSGLSKYCISLTIPPEILPFVMWDGSISNRPSDITGHSDIPFVFLQRCDFFTKIQLRFEDSHAVYLPVKFHVTEPFSLES